MGQTVNLLSFDFGGSNPSAPTQSRGDFLRKFCARQVNACIRNLAKPKLAQDFSRKKNLAEIAQSIEH